MDCCSPHMGPLLAVQGLGALKPLLNAFRRVQVPLYTRLPALDMSIGSLVCDDL